MSACQEEGPRAGPGWLGQTGGSREDSETLSTPTARRPAQDWKKVAPAVTFQCREVRRFSISLQQVGSL